jgi:hypothetical protein
MSRKGYSIFINTFFDGAVPSVTEPFPDGHGGEPERVCVFPTERDAQLEIVDAMMIRLQQFIDGERDFEDAVTLEEYVVEVEMPEDGD